MQKLIMFQSKYNSEQDYKLKKRKKYILISLGGSDLKIIQKILLKLLN